MSDKKKKSYKETNGTSKVGDFLRGLNLKQNLPKILGAGFDIVTGDFKGALEGFIGGNDELTPEQREYALKLLESDVAEEQERTKRWESDMNSDSWLAKNVRPIILMYLTFMMTLLAFLDSAVKNFTVKEMWVTLLTTLLLAVYVAYFGGRSYEKGKKL